MVTQEERVWLEKAARGLKSRGIEPTRDNLQKLLSKYRAKTKTETVEPMEKPIISRAMGGYIHVPFQETEKASTAVALPEAEITETKMVKPKGMKGITERPIPEEPTEEQLKQQKQTTFSEICKYNWNLGQQTVQRGKIGSDAMWGRVSIDEMTQKADSLDMEIQKAYDPKLADPKGFFKKVAGSSAELLPFMLGCTGEGIKQSLIIGGILAGAALLGGQMGPQVAAPEEIGTVPGAFAAGLKVGNYYGIIKYSMTVEGGNLFLDLVNKEGIDPAVARPVALGVGLGIGIIECSQITRLAKKMPFLKDIVSRGGKRFTKIPAVKSLLIGAVKRWAKDSGQEIAEEVLQEIVQIAGETIAIGIQAKKEGKPLRGIVAGDVIDRLGQVLKKSAYGMPAITLLPNIAQFGSDITALQDYKINKTAVEKGLPYVPPKEPLIVPKLPEKPKMEQAIIPEEKMEVKPPEITKVEEVKKKEVKKPELKLKLESVPKTAVGTKIKDLPFKQWVAEVLPPDAIERQIIEGGKIRYPRKMTEEFEPLRDMGMLIKNDVARTLDEVASDYRIDDEVLRQNLVSLYSQYTWAAKEKEVKGIKHLKQEEREVILKYGTAVLEFLDAKGIESAEAAKEYKEVLKEFEPIERRYPNILEKYGKQTGIAIKERSGWAKDRLKARFDRLTGLFNGNQYEEDADQWVEQGKNFIYTDLEGFGDFGDKYGDPAGNDVIEFNAEVLRQYKEKHPEVQAIYRPYGDTFIIIADKKIEATELRKINRELYEKIKKEYPDAEKIPQFRSNQAFPEAGEGPAKLLTRITKNIKKYKGDEHGFAPEAKYPDEFDPWVTTEEDYLPVEKAKPGLEMEGQKVRAPVAKKKQAMIPGTEAREFPKEMIKPETPEEKARAAMAEAKPKPLFETAGEKGAEQLRLGSQEGFFVGAGLSPEQMQLFIGAGLEPIATTAQGRITQYQNNKIRFDIPKVEKGKGFKEFLRTIYTHGFDRFHPISRLVHKDMNLPPLEDPKLLAYLSTGWQGKVIAALEGFTWRYTPAGKVEVTGPSLAQIIQPYSKNYKDIMTLQVAQRELWLAEQGRGTKGITPDFSLRTIGAIKEKYGEEGFKKLEMVAQQKREWANRAILEPLRDVGRISEKQYQRWIKDPHVPFARVIEEIESELGTEGRSGDLGFLKELKGSERIIKNPDQELIERLVTTTQYVDKQRVINSIVNLPQIATDLNGEIYEVGKGDLSPFKFKSWEDGKAKYFKVPKDVYKAVNDITPHDMGLLWKIIGIPKRMLQVGATLNPAFMGKNIWRDSGSAFTYSDNNFIPFVDHLPAVAHLIGRTDLYYRWLASGGAHAALVSMEDIKMGYKYWQLLGKKDVGAYVKNPLKFPEQIGEAIENSTRLGDFRKAIRSGRPDLIAAYASKEVSVNFARYGASMGIPRKTVAFYTANIAGGDRLVRAFKDHPGRTTWKALLFCTIPAITEWVLFHDDDRWRNLPPWRKYLFTNIPIGKHIFTMPVPFELGLIFGGLTKAFLTWAFDKEPQVMGKWAEQMVESMAPGYYGFPLPTAIMPVLEDRAKWSYFFNKPLPPKSVQGLPQEMQYTPYTSETMKAAGKFIGKSPTVLENYLFSYTGGLGKDVLFVVENILSKKGFISTPEAELPKGLADFPWTRGFFGREPIGTGSYPMQRFYEEYDKAKEQMNKIRVLTQRGKLSIEDLNKSEELAKYEVLDNMLKEINTLRRTRDALLWSKIDPVLKKEQLDKIDATITLLAAWTIKGLKKRKFKKP